MNRWICSWVLAAGAVCGAIGCDTPQSQFKPAAELPAVPAHDDHGHAHGEAAEGPHHGSLVELGEEEFHAEIVVDGKAHALKLYLLGPDGKTAASTSAAEATISVGSPGTELEFAL